MQNDELYRNSLKNRVQKKNFILFIWSEKEDRLRF